MEKEEELASVSKKKEAPLILMEEGQINSFVHVYNNTNLPFIPILSESFRFFS